MRSWDVNLINRMESMREEMDRLLGSARSFEKHPFSRVSFLPGRAARAYPLINISEDDANFYIDALAPGINLGTLDISIVQDHLHISGEKAPLPDVKPEAFHRRERAAGRFSRAVNLPGKVRAKEITANYTKGLLRLTLPKAEEAKPRKINVSVSE